VFQKFELSLKNSENFDAKEFIEMPYIVLTFQGPLPMGKPKTRWEKPDGN